MAATAFSVSGSSMTFKGFLFDNDLTLYKTIGTISAKGVPIEGDRLLENF